MPENRDLSPKERLLQIFRHAQTKGRAKTDIFGCRIQSHSFAFLRSQLAVLSPDAPHDAARLRDLFGRILFVHLSRKDKVAQAVSYVRAKQSGLWHQAADGTEIERLSEGQPLCYDAQAIAAQYQEMLQADEMWQNWFRQQDIQPLKINYETLSEAPQETLGMLLRELGCNSDAATKAVIPLARLADKISTEWCARFRATLDPNRATEE